MFWLVLVPPDLLNLPYFVYAPLLLLVFADYRCNVLIHLLAEGNDCGSEVQYS